MAETRPIESGKIVSREEVRSLADDAFRKGAEALRRVDDDPNAKPVKLFGLFEIDPGILAYVQGAYNVVADFATRVVGDRAYNITTALLKNTSLSQGNIHRAGALATLGADIAIKAGGYVGPVVSGFREQYDNKAQMARKIASVLDELKGSHSVSAFMSVKMQENEAIYVQRLRMLKRANAENWQNTIDLVVNAGPNVALSVPMFNEMWGANNVGKSPYVIQNERKARESEAAVNRTQATFSEELRTVGGTFLNASTGGIADHLKRSSQRYLEKHLQPYSALEMILELENQVSSNAKASSFRVPGKDGESYPLEEYIARVIIQHSKDMADVNPEYTDLRPALKDDLTAITEPIAQAMKRGDLAAMTLLRWVGEGKLIKDKGRKLATVAEVKQLLGTAEKAPQPSIHVEPKTYYADASFSKADLKLAIGALHGNERVMFAALFPDSILSEVGIKDAEIKSIRDASRQNYEVMLAQVLGGIAAKSDKELEREGLAGNEIKQLRDAYDALKEKGVAALHDLRASPANANGIERVMTNLAVSRVKGDKTYFGTMLTAGQAQLNALANAPEIKVKQQDKEEGADQERRDAMPAQAEASKPEMSHAEAVRQSAQETAAEPPTR